MVNEAYLNRLNAGLSGCSAQCEVGEVDRFHPFGLGVDHQCAKCERDAIGNAGLFGVQPQQPGLTQQRVGQRPLSELEQKQRQRGRKIYSLHADEVECIGKGKAHRPYEFGVKVSVATTLNRSKGGQFALHAMALPGNPYDGHTLATVIPDMEETIGNQLSRILADAGYRGHNAPESHKLRVFTSGQKRRVTPAIKRQMRRRSAVEPVIGHIKNEHRMDRNYLAGQQGDAINAVLAAVGYNFSLLLRWFRQFLCLLAAMLLASLPRPQRISTSNLG